MGNDIIQARYDVLGSVANRFGGQAQLGEISGFPRTTWEPEANGTGRVEWPCLFWFDGKVEV